jgi:hypothetical protein
LFGLFDAVVSPKEKERAVTLVAEVVPKLSKKIRKVFSLFRFIFGEDLSHQYGQLNCHEQFILGYVWADGVGVKKNELKGFRLLTLAADQGLDVAQFYLALCYEIGKGVAKDSSKAVEKFTLASDQGLAVAKYYLALCLESGHKLKLENLSKAVEMFTKATKLEVQAKIILVAQDMIPLVLEPVTARSHDDNYGRSQDQDQDEVCSLPHDSTVDANEDVHHRDEVDPESSGLAEYVSYLCERVVPDLHVPFDLLIDHHLSWDEGGTWIAYFKDLHDRLPAREGRLLHAAMKRIISSENYTGCEDRLLEMI